MKIKQQKSQGLTLIEALIWFAIFAAVVAGVFALYSNSRDSNLASSTNKEMSSIYANLSSIFQSENTSVLTPQIAYQLGAIPSSVKVSDDGKTLKNAFGGAINIISIQPSGFGLTYTNVPYGTVCSAIMQSQRKVGWNYMIDTAGNKITFDQTYSINQVGNVCKTDGSGSFQFTLYYYPNAN